MWYLRTALDSRSGNSFICSVSECVRLGISKFVYLMNANARLTTSFASESHDLTTSVGCFFGSWFCLEAMPYEKAWKGVLACWIPYDLWPPLLPTIFAWFRSAILAMWSIWIRHSRMSMMVDLCRRLCIYLSIYWWYKLSPVLSPPASTPTRFPSQKYPGTPGGTVQRNIYPTDARLRRQLVGSHFLHALDLLGYLPFSVPSHLQYVLHHRV